MDEQGGEPIEELTLEPMVVVRNRRPRSLWAVLAAVGLAAGALAVTSSDGDGGQRPGLPVDLASRTSGAGGEAALDAMLAWVTYVAGDDLPSLGGEGEAYRLSGEVDEARVRALADALGVEGEPQRTQGGWSVNGDGGVGRLGVHTGGGAYWDYFAGYQDCVAEDGGIGGCYADCTVDSDGVEQCPNLDEGCVRKGDVTECAVEGSSAGCPAGVACAPTTSTVEPQGAGADPERSMSMAACPAMPGVEPSEDCDDQVTVDLQPPVRPPDDVAGVALEVVAASGLDVDGAIVTGVPSGGEAASGQWYVTVEPRLDGIPSGLLSFIEVSSDHRVLSGHGVLGTVEELGDYPLLDTRAAIDRANDQMGASPMSEPGATGTAGATDGGGTTDVSGAPGEVEATTGGEAGAGAAGRDETVMTVVDPCSSPDGASDGCGGTTGCGGDGCTEPREGECKVQPDGREICELVCTDEPQPCSPAEDCFDYEPQATTTVPCSQPDCPQALAEEGPAVTAAPGAPGCTPPLPPEPVPLPEPEPVEIVLVEAERSLVLLPATDGSGDGYLIPAYRFTDEGGGQVDLPAVADEALAGPATTETTVPGTVPPLPEPQPDPQPCEILEEGEASGTTHTVQTCPTPNEDPGVLGEGEEPATGVGYYVDVDTQCAGGSFRLGSMVWITDDPEVAGWADPGERHEGGTFTLETPDRGTFVGDAAGTLVAEFHGTAGADLTCEPTPRS